MTRSTSDHSRADEPRRTRAAVLCAPGEIPPRTLLDALARRGVEAHVVSDAFAAALLLSRADAAEDERRPALIIVEPARHAGRAAEDLLRVVRRRLPGVAVWRFDEGARPPLRAMTTATFSDHADPPHAGTNGHAGVVVPSRAPAPALRLTHTPPPASSEPARDEDAPVEQPSALLSEEELAMLLSDDFDPPASR